jgi:hypothetical protein
MSARVRITVTVTCDADYGYVRRTIHAAAEDAEWAVGEWAVDRKTKVVTIESVSAVAPDVLTQVRVERVLQ